MAVRAHLGLAEVTNEAAEVVIAEACNVIGQNIKHDIDLGAPGALPKKNWQVAYINRVLSLRSPGRVCPGHPVTPRRAREGCRPMPSQGLRAAMPQ